MKINQFRAKDVSSLGHVLQSVFGDSGLCYSLGFASLGCGKSRLCYSLGYGESGLCNSLGCGESGLSSYLAV